MSKLNLKARAQDATKGSPVIADHEKIKTSELLLTYPNGIHVNRVDLVNGEKGPYPVINFTEAPNRFYSCGAVFNRVVNEWLDEADGDLSAVNDALAEEPVLCVFTMSKTKDGKHDLVICSFPN